MCYHFTTNNPLCQPENGGAHGNQFSDSGEMNIGKKDVSPEYFFVATLSLYKNVTDAKLASCITARDLAKHRRFYKGSLRNIPG